MAGKTSQVKYSETIIVACLAVTVLYWALLQWNCKPTVYPGCIKPMMGCWVTCV